MGTPACGRLGRDVATGLKPPPGFGADLKKKNQMEKEEYSNVYPATLATFCTNIHANIFSFHNIIYPFNFTFLPIYAPPPPSTAQMRVQPGAGANCKCAIVWVIQIV